MDKREERNFEFYDSGERPRKPYNQDADAEYDRLYKEYMYERKEKDDRSRSAGSSRGINISSFSDVPERKGAAARKQGGGKRKNKRKKTKAVIISAACVLLVFGVLLYFAWPFINYNYRKISTDPDDLGFEYVISDKITNIALFGLDTRDLGDFTGRSDSIMVLSINTETKKIKVISLMRDTIVKVEKGGRTYYTKLNNAYFDGGPELAVKTLNQNFGLDISKYATINFYGMVDIIDAVGGIEATVTEDELEWQGADMPNLNNCMEEICQNKGIDVSDYLIHKAGPQHLNGVQAVAYARVRHCLSTFGTNDDFGRTDRQRHVMQQLFSKAITMSKTDYLKLAKALLPCSETSLTFNQIISLAVDVLLKSPTFEQCRVPQMEWLMSFNYPEYGSCVYFDMEYARQAIHAIIYDDMTVEAFVEQNPIRKNDWFAAIYGSPSVQPPPTEPDDSSSSSSSSSSGDNSSSQTQSATDPDGEVTLPIDSSSGNSSEDGNSSDDDV